VCQNFRFRLSGDKIKTLKNIKLEKTLTKVEGQFNFLRIMQYVIVTTDAIVRCTINVLGFEAV